MTLPSVILPFSWRHFRTPSEHFQHRFQQDLVVCQVPIPDSWQQNWGYVATLYEQPTTFLLPLSYFANTRDLSRRFLVSLAMYRLFLIINAFSAVSSFSVGPSLTRPVTISVSDQTRRIQPCHTEPSNPISFSRLSQEPPHYSVGSDVITVSFIWRNDRFNQIMFDQSLPSFCQNTTSWKRWRTRTAVLPNSFWEKMGS